MSRQKSGSESGPISELLPVGEQRLEILPVQAWRQHHEVMLPPAD